MPLMRLKSVLLPCAVRTDEPQDLPFGEGEAHIVDGHHTAEVPAYVLYLEKRHHLTMARLRSAVSKPENLRAERSGRPT